MKKTVLSYNLPAEEEAALRRLAGDGVSVLSVPPGRFDVRLSALVKEDGEEKRAAFEEKTAEEPFRERMMVFAGFSEEAFDAFLSSLRTGKVGTGALKAVLTPSNSRWTSRELYWELVKEREAFFRLRENRKPWR